MNVHSKTNQKHACMCSWKFQTDANMNTTHTSKKLELNKISLQNSTLFAPGFDEIMLLDWPTGVYVCTFSLPLGNLLTRLIHVNERGTSGDLWPSCHNCERGVNIRCNQIAGHTSADLYTNWSGYSPGYAMTFTIVLFASVPDLSNGFLTMTCEL